jgi:hypothetical protein
MNREETMGMMIVITGVVPISALSFYAIAKFNDNLS